MQAPRHYNSSELTFAWGSRNSSAFGIILWMVAKSISHHFEPMVETIVCWYLRWGIAIPGFLNGGAKWISSIHSMFCRNIGSRFPLAPPVQLGFSWPGNETWGFPRKSNQNCSTHSAWLWLEQRYLYIYIYIHVFIYIYIHIYIYIYIYQNGTLANGTKEPC